MKLESDEKKIPVSNGEFDVASANRQIKDGVFKLLFENPENAAELYYAMTGTQCNPDEIQIITLSTTVSGKMKNDLAFVVKGRAMVIGEHMSSSYSNMPVRVLMYTGQLYEKWIKMKGEEKFLYQSKLYKIPKPEFVIFYNGAAIKPEKETLRLTSAYEDSGSEDFGHLELEVPVYNINKGMNVELFDKSSQLTQYSEFIATLREFNKLYDNYNQAVEKAVSHCIDNDILKKFLKQYGGEIVSILTMEYDVEVAKRVYGEELLEDRNIEIAKKLLKRGLPVSAIAEDTGLSESYILELQAGLSE